MRSDFEFYITNDVLVIIDQNLGRMSVTNDMENVLEWAYRTLRHLNIEMPKKIIYRDSEGIFDGVLYRNGEVTFYLIQARDEDAAILQARDE